MAYRDKPDLYLGRPTPEERRKQRHLMWLMPLFVLAPNLGRIAKWLGFRASYNLVLAATVVMTIACIAGAILSYRATRAQVAQDLAELTDTHL